MRKHLIKKHLSKERGRVQLSIDRTIRPFIQAPTKLPSDLSIYLSYPSYSYSYQRGSLPIENPLVPFSVLRNGNGHKDWGNFVEGMGCHGIPYTPSLLSCFLVRPSPPCSQCSPLPSPPPSTLLSLRNPLPFYPFVTPYPSTPIPHLSYPTLFSAFSCPPPPCLFAQFIQRYAPRRYPRPAAGYRTFRSPQ